MFGVTLIAVVLTLLRHWFEAERRGEQLQRQRLEAELSALRAQVHPHFLFNTLNNLYALTLKKSDQASEVVLKLSALLRITSYNVCYTKLLRTLPLTTLPASMLLLRVHGPGGTAQRLLPVLASHP